MLEEIYDLDNMQWGVSITFWLLISAGIWRFWAKSVVMGGIAYRLSIIVALGLIIPMIVKKVAD